MGSKNFVLCLIFVVLASADDASEFIIGGSDASLGQFKHMASIRYQTAPGSQESRHGCGGGVLNTRWVLTVNEFSVA
jgi:secreted trypsin-like serine protease